MLPLLCQLQNLEWQCMVYYSSLYACSNPFFDALDLEQFIIYILYLSVCLLVSNKRLNRSGPNSVYLTSHEALWMFKISKLCLQQFSILIDNPRFCFIKSANFFCFCFTLYTKRKCFIYILDGRGFRNLSRWAYFFYFLVGRVQIPQAEATPDTSGSTIYK